MATDPADYFAAQFKGKILSVQHDYCPSCFRGGKTDIVRLPAGLKPDDQRKKAAIWRKCFEDRHIDPVQALNAFNPGGTGCIAEFRDSLLNLHSPGEKCVNSQECHECCLFCRGLISTTDDKLRTRGKIRFNVHQRCMTVCSFIPVGKGKQHQCTAPVPAIPEYFKDVPRVLCKKHARQERNGGTPIVPQAPPPPPRQQRAPPAPVPSAPPSAPRPPAPPPPKKKAPERKPTKLERDSERGRSHDLATLWSSGAASATSDKKRATPDTTEDSYSHQARVVFTPHPHLAHKFSRRVFPADQ